jgi:hypothetical protein
MTFFNAALALGAAACVIPVVIHMLNRRRHRVIRWGAMHLIAPIERTNRRRIRLEQLILLLIRMAILALLALCMAGPVLTGWHALSGDAKTSLAIMFDNSYSMEAGAVGATGLEIAKRNAARLIEHQPRGSDISISLMAGGKAFGSTAPTTHRQRAADGIRGLPSGFGAADITESFDHATRALGKMQHTKRDLVIVSDFQAKDWIGDSASSLRQATELVAALPIRPTVTLMQVGSAMIDNLSVQSIEISPPVVAVGQRVSIRVNLRNHSRVAFPGVGVHLQVDRQDRHSGALDLGAGEDGQLLFEHTFADPGSHVIGVRADADTLPIDNSYLAVVQVWDRLPVLLVDGDPQPEILSSETGFLRLALSPFLTASSLSGPLLENTSEPADLLEATPVSLADLRSDDFAGRRVVVLANVNRLDAQQLGSLHQYVRAGGSLLVFPGDQIDAAWYRSQMCVATGLMPLTFESLRTKEANTDEHERDADASIVGASIATGRFDHPALDLFNDPRHGSLPDASMRTWYRLARPGIAIGQQLMLSGEYADFEGTHTEAESANVLARLDNDDPFLVENDFGKGRVMVCASGCDDDWSNLPSRPFYVPLMQRLVTYLAIAVEPRRNLSVGQTVVATIIGGNSDAALTRPDGVQVELTSQTGDRSGLIEYADTDQEGLYTLQSPSTPPMHYAVIAPRDESDLTRLDQQQLDALADSLDATLLRSTDEFIEQDSQRRYGREIWKPLYAVMLCLVVAEVLLQQFFSGIPIRQPGSQG